ncbi:hypothetical protein Lal_00044791 [Lupinus albus]|nr:hypothetical protein Lal_00044791 [Lupinus albus]
MTITSFTIIDNFNEHFHEIEKLFQRTRRSLKDYPPMSYPNGYEKFNLFFQSLMGISLAYIFKYELIIVSSSCSLNIIFYIFI